LNENIFTFTLPEKDAKLLKKSLFKKELVLIEKTISLTNHLNYEGQEVIIFKLAGDNGDKTKIFVKNENIWSEVSAEKDIHDVEHCRCDAP